MHIFYTPDHGRHAPQFEFFNGEQVPASEIPMRLEQILRVLRRENYPLTPVQNTPVSLVLLDLLNTIHAPEYITWIQNIQPENALYPSVFNASGTVRQSGHPSIQWGNFCSDLFTPLLPDTWAAASTMAQAVYTGAERLRENPQEIVVVMGRPPGHHAGRSQVGGYCYLNNAAVAAEFLSRTGSVAVLDVDYHHGNGTQDIFYDRSDVITCSIHADPVRKFPYFAGFEDERGIEAGDGYNRNFPLPPGVTDEQYQPVLESALKWIHSNNPQYLIVSLGVDTHESDPIADFQLSTAYYSQMAQTIVQLGIPTLVVLEGGYSTDVIGDNVASFLAGFNQR